MKKKKGVLKKYTEQKLIEFHKQMDKLKQSKQNQYQTYLIRKIKSFGEEIFQQKGHTSSSLILSESEKDQSQVTIEPFPTKRKQTSHQESPMYQHKIKNSKKQMIYSLGLRQSLSTTIKNKIIFSGRSGCRKNSKSKQRKQQKQDKVGYKIESNVYGRLKTQTKYLNKEQKMKGEWKNFIDRQEQWRRNKRKNLQRLRIEERERSNQSNDYSKNPYHNKNKKSPSNKLSKTFKKQILNPEEKYLGNFSSYNYLIKNQDVQFSDLHHIKYHFS